MCIYSLREIIGSYSQLNACVFLCFLDASKAFDRVTHSMLFTKLLRRGAPGYIVRFLMFCMRRKSRDNAEARLYRLASEVERLHHGAKMFRAVREMTRKPVAKLTIHDNSGRTICNAAELNARVTEHFTSQFIGPSVDGLNACTDTLSRLTHRITPAEIKRAIGKLNSGRASGHDDIPAELFKCSADLLAQHIANIFNDALEHHEPLGLGKGVLILIQKPGNPKGPLTSVLLTTLRKTLSLVVLSRIAPKFDEYLSPSQTRIPLALCQSATSASIDRIPWHRPESLRHNPPRQTSRHTTDIPRRIRNADDSHTARRHFTRTATLNRRMSRFRDIYWHASRGDSLSPVLFTVYLEAARSARPSVAPPDAPSNRCQLTARRWVCRRYRFH